MSQDAQGSRAHICYFTCPISEYLMKKAKPTRYVIVNDAKGVRTYRMPTHTHKTEAEDQESDGLLCPACTFNQAIKDIEEVGILAPPRTQTRKGGTRDEQQ